MEGVRLFDPSIVGGEMSREEWLESDACKLVADDLKATLEGMVDSIFASRFSAVSGANALASAAGENVLRLQEMVPLI